MMSVIILQSTFVLMEVKLMDILEGIWGTKENMYIYS